MSNYDNDDKIECIKNDASQHCVDEQCAKSPPLSPNDRCVSNDSSQIKHKYDKDRNYPDHITKILGFPDRRNNRSASIDYYKKPKKEKVDRCEDASSEIKKSTIFVDHNNNDDDYQKFTRRTKPLTISSMAEQEKKRCDDDLQKVTIEVVEHNNRKSDYNRNNLLRQKRQSIEEGFVDEDDDENDDIVRLESIDRFDDRPVCTRSSPNDILQRSSSNSRSKGNDNFKNNNNGNNKNNKKDDNKPRKLTVSFDDSVTLLNRRRRFSVRTLSEGVASIPHHGDQDHVRTPISPTISAKKHPLKSLFHQSIGCRFGTTSDEPKVTAIDGTRTATSPTPKCGNANSFFKLTNSGSSLDATSTLPLSSSHTLPPRPTILKSSSNLFNNNNGAQHQRRCSIKNRAVHHRRRNMSGDLFAVNHLHQSAKQPHSNDVTTTLSQMSISDMNRYHRSRRRHLFPNHSQTDDCFSDDSSGENYKQHRHHDKECICEQSPLSADIKSVHILEPIKSAGTIFDPTETARKSIAKSLIAHNNVDRQQQLSAETSRSDDSPQHRTTTASEIPHGNLSQLQNWHDNNMQLARDVDVQSKPATIVATKSPIQPLISPERTVMQSSSDDGLLLDENHHSLTPLINDKHYGENDSSERRLVSPQRRNSHPTTISSNNSSMNESQSTEVWDFFDYESDSYWPDCSPYRDTVVRVFGPIDSPKNNGNIRKMMCTYVGGYGTSSSSSSAYTALYNHKNQQKQQSREYCNNLSADDDDNDDDDNDDNSEMDHPRYCKICDIWFGSLDPSYPFKCNCENPTKTETLNTLDTQSVYSVHMRKDFRYFFQHPYSRLFIAYLVVFCNFLIFAEDPISHSLRECKIPILGNVISFLFTKYPPEPDWQLFKGALAVVGIVFGLLFGKYVLHHIVLRRLFRLKMFRNESGSWMIMSISMVLSVFVFSMVYNIILRMFHPNAIAYLITQRMGISFASFMKIAACGTWLGDFFTAWMITDMMLQDNLYPDWAKWLRRFWHRHPNIRVFIFWGGALVIAATVITIILTDRICWDQFNHGFIITSELSRAILASFILFMDLLIVMQDWDFPHFVCDLNIKLPGMLQPSYTFNFCRKSLKFPEFEVKVSGKWFNYGIIVFVMMLDLNMWRNQVIYYPADFGQYVDPINHKVFTVNETDVIADPAFTMLHIDDADRSSNATVWTYETRKIMIDPATNRSAIYSDLVIESRYHGYAAMLKALTFIPGFLGLVCFFLLIFLYGRFPPKTDKSIGGRLKKRDRMHKSSWRRERRDSRGCHHSSWPAISNYCVDPNRIIRQHDNSDIDFSMSPNRPTYMMFSGVQIDLQTPLPTANKLQAETSININPEPKSTKPIEQNKEIIPQLRSPSVLPDIVIPFVPEHLNEHQSSRSPLSAQSSSTSSSPSPPNVSISSYLPRLLPQFNAPLLWSSIVSILNLSSNKTPAQPSSSPVTGPVTNICVQPLRTIPNEWLRLDHVLSHTSPVSFSVSASPSQQSSSCAEIKFGTIPSFQPSNKPIIPFQTQVVQLPIRAS